MKCSICSLVALVLALILAACICLALTVFPASWNIDPGGIRILSGDPTPVLGTYSQEETLQVFTGTLHTLENTIVPENDLRLLAQRLQGKSDVPETLQEPPPDYQVGDRKDFWVVNVDTNEHRQVQARLEYETEHLYFWVHDGVTVDAEDVRLLAETFENEIYPTTRAFFGSEWTPGVDGDPHLYVLYARGLGSVAGYFSSSDEYTPEAHPYSNAHEMFLLSADHVSLDEEYAYTVLAHEFEHMIHWARDRNEESWMDEGFAELSALLNGYSGGGNDYLYAREPDMQLTYWPADTMDMVPHYGASFLFLSYFLDRFGDEATQMLIAHPENSLVSMDLLLEEIGAQDPITGEALRADRLFMDWLVTSYLQDPEAADGRYQYRRYTQAPSPSATERISSCPTGVFERDVHQYGADYIHLGCRGDYKLRFEGSVRAPLLPTDAYSGDFAFWSNKGNESDMTLTRQFDFREHSAPLHLEFRTWYDLEEDYDYLYVEASEDGEYWEILTTPSGTAENPSGNSYGWAYNGMSGGGRQAEWIQERVDISQYAGKQVFLRFEYVTDAAVYGEGFLLDDVSILETGYFTNFEQDDGGWKAEGFARVKNELPQTFRLALITWGEQVEVQHFDLESGNTLEIPLPFDEEFDEAVLVVAGTTRFTNQKAAYRYSILP